MTTEWLWGVAKVAVGTGYLLPLFAYLLKQRLVLQGEWVGTKDGDDEYVIVLHNAEAVPLMVPFELRAEVLGRGSIKDAHIRTGDATVDTKRQAMTSEERGSCVWRSAGIGGMATWRVSITTTGFAQRLRMRVRGWDPRENKPRQWFPVLSRESIVLELTPADRGSRGVRNRPGWLWALLGVGLSVLTYTVLCRPGPALDPAVDGVIVIALVAASAVAYYQFAQSLEPMPLGFLASDEYWNAPSNDRPDQPNAASSTQPSSGTDPATRSVVK